VHVKKWYTYTKHSTELWKKLANILSFILSPYFGVDVSDKIFDFNNQPEDSFTTEVTTFGTKRVKDVTSMTAAFWVMTV
jgi:hypothetical protein